MEMFLGTRQAYSRVLDGGDEEVAAHNSDDEGHHQNNAPPKSHDIGSVNIDVGENQDISRSKQEHRWDHIENIDQFFGLVYEYHQGSGFMCIALRQAFALFQFIFVICFSSFLLQCVDYDVLFNNVNVTTTGEPIIGKIQIGDAIIPHCTRNFSPLVVFSLLLAIVFWLCQLVCIGYRMFQLCEIRTFYATALEIPDAELSNVAWEEVVEKLCVLQPKLQLIINQETLTPLDVYQRILRFKNYFIGLIYNDILPPRISLPGGGVTYYLSSGLRFNLEWLLFWGPWSPWKNSYSLKDEFKDKVNLESLADKLRTTIAWMSVINLVFSPFIFLYQVLFNFFSSADSIKREPGFFGMRKFSIYGKERLRHFNELDHELNARLNSCYGFSVRYMNQFVSPTAEIVAKTVAFMAGSIFAVLFILSAIDEVVVNVEHVLSIMTVCGVAVIACRTFIPSENFFPCQKLLMEKIIGGIHYAPKSWLRKAFTAEVYQEFSQLFQMKAQILVEELVSPLATPILLYFSIRPKASALVLFFYNHTHHDEQLGDVCSYSVMDITRDGDDSLRPLNESMTKNYGLAKNLIRKPASCGKVELSLLNFVKMYPTWQPPSSCGDFIQKMRLLAQQEMQLKSLDIVMQGSRDLTGSMQMSSVPARYAAPVVVSDSTASHSVPPNHHDTMAALPSDHHDDYDNYGVHCDHSQIHDLPGLSAAYAVEECAEATRSDSEEDEENEANVFRRLDDKKPLPPQCLMNMTASAGRDGLTAASTFIQPYPLDSQLGGGSSRHLMDPDARAMDMSYNALALNRILASTISRQPTAAQGAHIGSGRRAGRSSGGYGALSNQIRGGDGTEPTVSFRSGTAMAGRSMMTGSTATSNIYGVPEASQMLLRNLDDED